VSTGSDEGQQVHVVMECGSVPGADIELTTISSRQKNGCAWRWCGNKQPDLAGGVKRLSGLEKER
jgi:hypothetical protein